MEVTIHSNRGFCVVLLVSLLLAIFAMNCSAQGHRDSTDSNHSSLDSAAINLMIYADGDWPTKEADLQAIKAYIANQDKAVNAGDATAEANQFTEDGIYLWPDAPAIEGRDAIREWFTARLANSIINVTSQTKELRVFDGWAFERGIFEGRVRPKQSETEIVFYGKYLNILRRLPDGSWKISHRIRNNDHPLP